MTLEEVGVKLVTENLNSFLSAMRESEDAVRLMGKAEDIAAQQSETMSKGVEDATESATESADKFRTLHEITSILSNGFEIASRVLGYLQQAYAATAGETLAYADQVRELSRTIGASAEEASMLIQAGDDMQVSVDTIQRAMEGAIRKGYEPTIEGLGKIADEYNALPSQIERTAYAMDVFGKSGADMIPLLQKGSKGIREMGDEARALGLTLTDVEVAQAKMFEKQMDNLEDLKKSYQYKIGNVIIPQLTAYGRILEQEFTGKGLKSVGDFANEYLNVYKEGLGAAAEAAAANGKVRISVDEVGVSYYEAAARANGYAVATWETQQAAEAASAAYKLQTENLMLQAGLAGQMQKANEQSTETAETLTKKQKELQTEIDRLSRSNHTYVTSTKKATASAEDLSSAQLGADIAARRLADAQTKLATNKDTGRVRDLETSVMSAQLSYQNAANRVNELNGKMGESSQVFVNNDKKLGELRESLAEVNQSLADNAKAHEDATRRIALSYLQQALAAKGASDPQFMLDVARNMGAISEADYNMQKAYIGLAEQVAGLKGQYKEGTAGYKAAYEQLIKDAKYIADDIDLRLSVVPVINPTSYDEAMGRVGKLSGDVRPKIYPLMDPTSYEEAMGLRGQLSADMAAILRIGFQVGSFQYQQYAQQYTSPSTPAPAAPSNNSRTVNNNTGPLTVNNYGVNNAAATGAATSNAIRRGLRAGGYE